MKAIHCRCRQPDASAFRLIFRQRTCGGRVRARPLTQPARLGFEEVDSAGGLLLQQQIGDVGFGVEVQHEFAGVIDSKRLWGG